MVYFLTFKPAPQMLDCSEKSPHTRQSTLDHISHGGSCTEAIFVYVVYVCAPVCLLHSCLFLVGQQGDVTEWAGYEARVNAKLSPGSV